eukprot:gene31439-38000_t
MQRVVEADYRDNTDKQDKKDADKQIVRSIIPQLSVQDLVQIDLIVEVLHGSGLITSPCTIKALRKALDEALQTVTQYALAQLKSIAQVEIPNVFWGEMDRPWWIIDAADREFIADNHGHIPVEDEDDALVDLQDEENWANADDDFHTTFGTSGTSYLAWSNEEFESGNSVMSASSSVALTGDGKVCGRPFITAEVRSRDFDGYYQGPGRVGLIFKDPVSDQMQLNTVVATAVEEYIYDAPPYFPAITQVQHGLLRIPAISPQPLLIEYMPHPDSQVMNLLNPNVVSLEVSRAVGLLCHLSRVLQNGRELAKVHGYVSHGNDTIYLGLSDIV